MEKSEHISQIIFEDKYTNHTKAIQILLKQANISNWLYEHGGKRCIAGGEQGGRSQAKGRDDPPQRLHRHRRLYYR
jgi:hypothetical protein